MDYTEDCYQDHIFLMYHELYDTIMESMYSKKSLDTLIQYYQKNIFMDLFLSNDLLIIHKSNPLFYTYLTQHNRRIIIETDNVEYFTTIPYSYSSFFYELLLMLTYRSIRIIDKLFSFQNTYQLLSKFELHDFSKLFYQYLENTNDYKFLKSVYRYFKDLPIIKDANVFIEYKIQKRIYKKTTEPCIISYEIPKYYVECKSNGHHIIDLDIYKKLDSPECPYCKQDIDCVIYMNKQ